MILLCLILDDSEFRVNILLHLIFIPVQMIGSDVKQDGYVRFKFNHSIQRTKAKLWVQLICRISDLSLVPIRIRSFLRVSDRSSCQFQDLAIDIQGAGSNVSNAFFKAFFGCPE